MLQLALEDRDAWRIELWLDEDPIRLTPVPLPLGLVAEPEVGVISVLVAETHHLVELLLIRQARLARARDRNDLAELRAFISEHDQANLNWI